MTEGFSQAGCSPCQERTLFYRFIITQLHSHPHRHFKQLALTHEQQECDVTSIADPQQPKRLGKGSELLHVQRWSASAYVGLPRAYCGGTWGISGGIAGWGGVGELDMSRNCIRCLPPALLQLPLLRRILASRNRITYIHPSLHHLSRLQVGG